MNVLHQILDHKREEVAARKRTLSRRQLEGKELFSYRSLSLERALRSKTPSFIAEVKRASPSQGVIRPDFDALAIARDYVQHGAAALSVLTDERFFQGDIRFIERMRKFVLIPILRKDFIVDEYQLYEAKAFGADAVLLIVAALERVRMSDFLALAKEIDLECLVEVHSQEEIEQLDFHKVRIVGINNRDLATFKTDLTTSVVLRKLIPADVEVVSESAINGPGDIELLMASGIRSFLIGERFMRAESPGKALAELQQQSERLRA